VRLLDYGKYQYEQAKAESKSRSHAPEVKEIRLTLKIGQHDFDVKKSQADRWLNDGDRVRVTATLRGRELAFPGQAHALIERMRVALGAEYEMAVSRLGKRFSAIVGRKR
ncbi:MAG: translation initiation factor IF-3, partial [Patescibacteria group bacterium]